MRPISYTTYKAYAKKYKIKLSYINSLGKRQKKSMAELAQEIYDFENENKITGLYFYWINILMNLFKI